MRTNTVGGSTTAIVDRVNGIQTVLSSQSSVISALATVISRIDVFVNIVDRAASVHPYATLAWQVVSSVYKIVQRQVITDQKLIGLVTTMENIYSFVDAIQSDVTEKVKVLEDTIKRIFLQTVECAIFIREYANHSFAGRVLRGTLKDDAGTIEGFSQSLLGLKRDFDSGVAIQTVIASFRTKEEVSAILRKQTLLELAPAEMEASGRTECLPSTRLDVLSNIVDWATDPSRDENVFWLHGLAGSGKSTLFSTVASYFRDLGRLGAFYFFDRSYPQRSHPSKVIRTLAYKLGSFDPRIGTAICAAIDNFPSVNDASLHVQFTKLLIEPLASLTDLTAEGPIVLVLDALDECGNSTERESLLTLLGTEMSRLPSVIRVLVTSRKLDDITAAFEGQQNVLAQSLEVSSEIGRKDILTYFEHRFVGIRRKKAHLRSDWPGDEVIRELGMHSCGLFVWASTAAKFLDGFDPEKRLAIILRGDTASGAQLALDNLYRTALEDATAWDDDDFVQHFRTVLGTILVLQHPLTTCTLDRLIGLREGRESSLAVSALACVVADNPTIHLLHPSFADFLFSRTRCGRDMWHFDAAICHQDLALKCLNRLSNNGLKRNICQLRLSVALKDESVPDDVAYACVCWANHAWFINRNVPSAVAHLETFLTKHLLHWFEVMSILKKSRETVALLESLYIRITAHFPDQHNLAGLLRNAWRFAQTFGTLIEEHPLLVYSAALPFTPITSVIYQIFHNDQTCPTVSGGFEQSWSNLLHVFSGHTDQVDAVAFSPDGTRIVSGSADKTVRVWSAVSGTEVITPLRGHEGWVTSVAFSPDGTRIISGSMDNSVRVWDTVSYTEMIPPVRGHESEVFSVAFSPDGAWFVSGSGDNTVRIWDTVSGTEVVPPLLGHKGSVFSVAFSPDGIHVVSGSFDRTVRVCDIVSGAEAILRGHKDAVFSVAFSPDGTRVVSGSADQTVRVWDAVSGREVAPPFRGHEGPITSVSFSPSGTRLISGSRDDTVRVWEVLSGTNVIPPLRSHSGSVFSVGFSPDETHVISGSFDKTVHMLDIVSGSGVVSPFQGHKGEVYSIAFSLDGTRIVSGSIDKTVCVWDAALGTEVFPPLRGHEDWVFSVTFSPDGTRIVSGSGDMTVRVWDAVSGCEVVPPLRGHKGAINSVSFSSDNIHIVSGSVDQTVCVWDVTSGTKLVYSIRGHEGSVSSVAFSPDGTCVASGSYDKTVRLWDAVSGTEMIPPFRGHEDWVYSVAFSPDGTHIVSGSEDKTVRVWNVVSGIEAILLVHESPVSLVTFSPDGTYIISRSNSRVSPKTSNVCIWDAATGLSYPGIGAGELTSHDFPPALAIDQYGWIVDCLTNRTISKLPAMIVLSCLATFGRLLAIGTVRGQVLILNFPPAVFSSSESQPP